MDDNLTYLTIDLLFQQERENDERRQKEIEEDQNNKERGINNE